MKIWLAYFSIINQSNDETRENKVTTYRPSSRSKSVLESIGEDRDSVSYLLKANTQFTANSGGRDSSLDSPLCHLHSSWMWGLRPSSSKGWRSVILWVMAEHTGSTATPPPLRCARCCDFYHVLPSPSLCEAFCRILRGGTHNPGSKDFSPASKGLAQSWSRGKCENFPWRVPTLSLVLQPKLFYFFLLDLTAVTCMLQTSGKLVKLP